jgi:putative ABC transport system permease protein
MWPFRRRTDEDFQREIESHQAIEIDRLIAEGLSRDEARHAAARTFGNVTTTRERFYESRRVLWLDELRQDVRYGFRALGRSPGFATVAILTLALGIGANTAIFSVVNAVVLRPLPYRDPASLVLIETSPFNPAPPWLRSSFRERARTLSGFAGFDGPRSATLIAGGEPEPVQSARVTWNFLSFLGVAPAAGRDFTEGEASAGAAPVALLSHELWMSRFGGDEAIVGRTVTLSGDAVTIVGVTPPTFRFPAADVLSATAMPVDTQPDVMRVAAADEPVSVIGRLAAGATPAAAAVELLALFKESAQTTRFFRQSLIERLELKVGLLQERLAGNIRGRLWLAMGAVGFVLLVVCANVANLLGARASTRQRELAVRAALGARRGRLARLLLTESMLLALAGSGGGLLLAFMTRDVARTLLAGRLPHVDAIAVDWWVLAFTVAVASVTGMLCGLASIPGATRVNLTGVFSGGVAPAVTGRTALRRALLSFQVAVTFVLVVGAALLAQTLWHMSTADRGFDARQLLTVRVAPGLPPGLAQNDPRAQQRFFAGFFTELTERMGRMPGVASAAAVSSVPFAGLGAGMGGVRVEGQPVQQEDDSLAMVAMVSPGYFLTMGIPIVAGRDFDERNRLGGEKVAIVNGAFRRRYAPNGDITGSRIIAGTDAITIVGVVGDVPDRSWRDASEPLVFLALRQMPMHAFWWGQLRMVLRTVEGDPLAAVPAVRREIWKIDPNIVIDEIATMDERVAVTMRAERDSALVFGLLAVAALAIAAIGVYGVAAYAMAQRTKEIGIRVALGAAKRDVSRLVVSQTLWPTLIGIAVGIGGASLATRLVASMVYGVTPLDPSTFAVAVLALVAVALAATWVPVRRATRIDPLTALRYE